MSYYDFLNRMWMCCINMTTYSTDKLKKMIYYNAAFGFHLKKEALDNFNQKATEAQISRLEQFEEIVKEYQILWEGENDII